MDTDALIDSLAAGLRPAEGRTPRRLVTLALIVAVPVVLFLVVMPIGLRPDLAVAVTGSMFWMKLAYTATIGAIGVAAAAVLFRPETTPPRWLWLLAVPVVVFFAGAVREALSMPAPDFMGVWFGPSWTVCSALIFGLSLPVAVSLIWVARRLAPTRLRATGAMIGLASGGVSATLYSLHCPEAGASFVLTWYTLGILIPAALGALLGPRLLRWA